LSRSYKARKYKVKYLTWARIYVILKVESEEENMSEQEINEMYLDYLSKYNGDSLNDTFQKLK